MMKVKKKKFSGKQSKKKKKRKWFTEVKLSPPPLPIFNSLFYFDVSSVFFVFSFVPPSFIWSNMMLKTSFLDNFNWYRREKGRKNKNEIRIKRKWVKRVMVFCFAFLLVFQKRLIEEYCGHCNYFFVLNFWKKKIIIIEWQSCKEVFFILLLLLPLLSSIFALSSAVVPRLNKKDSYHHLLEKILSAAHFNDTSKISQSIHSWLFTFYRYFWLCVLQMMILDVC